MNRATDAKSQLDKNTDTTFGMHKKQDGQLGMGNKAVQLDENTEYKLTPGLQALIALKHPPDRTASDMLASDTTITSPYLLLWKS